MGSEHKRLFIPLGDFSPDPPHIGLGKLRRMRDMLPIAGGGLCLPAAFEASSGVDDTNFTNNGLTKPANEATSLFAHYTGELVTTTPDQYSWFTPDLYIGGDADIVLLPGMAAASATNVSNTALGAYGTGTYKPERWSFASWSWDSVVAVNGSDYPQVYYYGGSGRFTDMIQTGATHMIASHAAILGKHIVLGNIKFEAEGATPDGNPQCTTFFGDKNDLFHPDIVWWSGTDDETTFGDETSNPGENTGWQAVDDTPGGITGMVRVGDRALLIFKPSSVYIMELTGSDELFHFSMLSASIGTTLTKSIVAVGRDVYFISQSGHPYVIKNLSAIEEIGVNAVTMFFGAVYGALTSMAEDVQTPFWVWTRMHVPDPFGAYSQNFDTVFWTYRVQKFSEGEIVLTDRCLCYKINENKWWDYEIAELTLAADATLSEFKSIPIASYMRDEYGYDQGTFDTKTEFPGIVAYDHYADDKETYYTSKLVYLAEVPSASSTPMDVSIRTKPFGFGSESVVSSPAATIYAVRPIFDRAITGLTTTISVTSAPFSDFASRTSYKTSGSTLTSSGWYTISGGKVSGEFFIIDMDVTHTGIARNGPHFLGFEIEYSLDGKRP